MNAFSNPLQPRVLRATIRRALYPLAAISCGFHASHADTFEWTSPVNGLFTTAGNWTNTTGIDFAPPNAGDTALFNEVGIYTVTLSTLPVASDFLQVIAGSVTFRENASGGGGIYKLTTGAADARITGSSTILTLGVLNDPVSLDIGDDLNVQSGARLDVLFDSDVVANDLLIGTAGSGLTSTVIVDGAGSTLTRKSSLGSITLGQNGATGNLTFRNGAAGDLNGTLVVCSSSNSLSAGNVGVESGASLHLDSVILGGSTDSAVPQGLLAVTGTGSTITQTGSSALTVGLASGNIGVLNVNSAGVFTSGTGNTTVNATGTINVDDGTMNFGGNLTLNGGSYLENQASTATRSFADNSTITVQNGGIMTLNSTQFSTQLPVQRGQTFVLDGSTSQVNLEGSFTSLAIGGISDPTTSTVTLRNNANLSVRDSSMLAAQGQTSILNIQSGAKLVTNGGSFSIGGPVGSNGSALINIDGLGSSLRLQNLFSPLGLGSTDGATAAMNLTNSADFTSDDNGMVVNATGTIHLDGGALRMNGDLRVKGGIIQSGVGYGRLAPQPFADLEVRVSEGGSVSLRQDILELAGNRLVVEGPGSSFSIASATADQGNLWLLNLHNPTPGSVTVRDGGSLEVGTLNTSGSAFSTTATNTIDISGGGTATVNHLGVGLMIFDDGLGLFETAYYEPGELEIDGPGSRLAIRAGYQAHVGSALEDAEQSGVHGTVHLTNGGELDTTAGTLFLNRAGILNLAGGVLRTGPIVHDFRCEVNFTAGTLSTTSPWVVGNQQLLGPAVELTSGKHVVTTGSTTVDANGSLSINGGSLTTGTLSVSSGGSFAFHSGSLNLTGSSLTLGSGGLLGGSLQLGAGSSLAVGGDADLAAESYLDLTGGSFSADNLEVSGQIFFDGGSLGVADLLDIKTGGRLFVDQGRSLSLVADIANSGRIELLGAGARLMGPGTLGNSGLITGDGQIGMALDNLATGEIRAASGKTISLTGAVSANSGLISLLGGMLETTGPLSNGATGDITGRGVLFIGGSGLLNTGDLALSNGYTDIFADVNNQGTGRVIISGNANVTFWGDVAHTGSLFRVATGSSVTFFGQAGFGVSGGGDVFFEDDITPGASPGLETFGGNVFFGAGAALEIEIAGAAPGSGHDRLEIDGTTLLDGRLVVSLLGGYEPQPGETFSIMAANGGVLGNFTDENFHAAPLAPGLGWQVDYQSGSVVLEVVVEDAFAYWIHSFPAITLPADRTLTANPDLDGLPNFAEFALDEDPSSGTASGKYVVKITNVGGVNVLTLTLPVRTGAVPAPADPPGGPLVLQKVSDALIYTVRATDDLLMHDLDVTEVIGPDAAAIQTGLPAVGNGWEYRTFRSPGPVSGTLREFMHVGITPVTP